MQTKRDQLPGADQPYFLDSGEGIRSLLLGVHVTTLARSVDTGGLFGLTLFQGPAGLGAPPHHHENDAEAFFVLEGRIRWWIGEEERVVYPGDFAYWPAGVPHAFRFEGAYNKLLGYNFPGGFESFFEELGQPTDAYASVPTEFVRPSPEKFAEVTKKHAWVRRDDLKIDPEAFAGKAL